MISDHKTVIVLDLETTGLDHRTERIIEIGAVRLHDGEVIDRFETLVKPDVPIRHSSFKIHNISEEMVADAPPIEEVLPKILAFVEDLPFVAHNAIFDYSFLNEASKRLYEKRLPNLRIDTFDMYKTVFPEEHSHGLSSLLAKFGFESHVMHRALDDANNLALVYPKLLEYYEQQKVWQFSQIPNVPYLIERYQRLQKTLQFFQAEMADLKEIFKLHFQQGGEPIMTASGELMVSNYRRNYEYNDQALRYLIDMSGLQKQAYKVNPRAVDKLIDNPEIDEDIRSGLKDARVLMTETRQITFIKPSETKELVEEEIIELKEEIVVE